MEKLQNVDWRGLYKTATNKVKKYAMNLSELEIKVEEATDNEVRLAPCLYHEKEWEVICVPSQGGLGAAVSGDARAQMRCVCWWWTHAVPHMSPAQVWGPHGTVMNEIAEASYDMESYQQIMGVLARRLKETVRVARC